MDRELLSKKESKDNKKQEKSYKWLARTSNMLGMLNLDTQLLYQEHKVCAVCYKLYTETEKLIEIEYQIASKLGIPASIETKFNLVNIDLNEHDPEDEKNIKDLYGG